MKPYQKSFLLMLLFMLPAVTFAGPVDKVAELIKQGNTQDLAKYFAANIDLTVQENTNTYSRAQAQLIIEKFFKENRPVSVNILHRVNSSAAYNFGVIILNTDKGKYRIGVTMREIEKQMQIIEMRIEAEKT